MEVEATLIGPTVGKTALKAFPRWVSGRINLDLMEAAAIHSIWSYRLEDRAIINAKYLDRALREISDVSMPRKGISKRPSVYWWNSDIAELRRACNRFRRRLIRERARRNPQPETIRARWDALREARRELRKAIFRYKARMWRELVDDLDRDPWGTPYRVVMKKLHSGGVSIVEVLPPEIVEEIVATLFPVDRIPRNGGTTFEWRDDLAVTIEEVIEAGTNIKAGKAPGPDGIAGSVIKATLEHLAPLWARCFTECLRGGGHFPRSWKTAKLVLIKKPGKPELSPSSYRPICLLSEASKLFERVLAGRLRAHLDSTEDIAERQYGFRKHRSTIFGSLRERIDGNLRERGGRDRFISGYSERVQLPPVVGYKKGLDGEGGAGVPSERP